MKGKPDGEAYVTGRCKHGFRLYAITGSAGAWHSSPRAPARGETYADISTGIRVFLCNRIPPPRITRAHDVAASTATS